MYHYRYMFSFSMYVHCPSITVLLSIFIVHIACARTISVFVFCTMKILCAILSSDMHQLASASYLNSPNWLYINKSCMLLLLLVLFMPFILYFNVDFRVYYCALDNLCYVTCIYTTQIIYFYFTSMYFTRGNRICVLLYLILAPPLRLL